MKRQNKKLKKEMIIYQAKDGAIELRGDFNNETIWATQAQIVDIFGIDQSVVSRHINNIISDNEVNKKSNMQKMHIANSDKPVLFYSLDIILAVGYRTNSSKAIAFRIWATKTLKQHLVSGYTINKKRVGANYQKFLQAVSGVKALLPAENIIDNKDILELINVFANTWFSLDAYDKESFPQKGTTKKQAIFTAQELKTSLLDLKITLIKKKQATELFGQERNRDSIGGIVGNVFQTFGKKDVYPTTEEKAANLLYFVVKNHPFTDGNKRSGAFSFVWFLRKTGTLRASLTPEALTALTLLVAESKSKDKDKIIGLILLLLNTK
jgi:prophage maintenance system killer protein